jgi:hypothetical protein
MFYNFHDSPPASRSKKGESRKLINYAELDLMVAYY